MLEGFPLITPFTVPFADVDMMQHVNNVAYIRWAEMMRSEYFARVMKTPVNGDHGMIQASINFTYERQLTYRERIAVGVRVSRIGSKSFDFEYAVWSVDASHQAAHGFTTVVAYDFVARRTIVVPESWRENIAAYQSGPQEQFN